MAWSRTILFKSAFLSSVVSVVIPLLVATLTRLEYVALWLGARASVQLLVAALPSPVHTLLQSQGGQMSAEEVEEVSRRAPLYLLIITALVFGAVLLLVGMSSAPLLRDGPDSLRWALALLAATMFLSSSSGGVLRVVKRADVIFRIAKADLVLSIATLPVLLFGFPAFLLASAAKEAAKAAMAIPSFGRPQLSLPQWRSLLSGKAQYVRGLTQVASQYLERTVYPFLFGLKVAGQLGLGSTLGILPVMLSSNMYLWAFPKVAQGEEQARDAVVFEWAQLLALAASLCWWLGAASAVADLGPYGAKEVAAAASFTAFLGVGFLAVARSRDALLGAASSLLHLAVLASIYLTVGLAAEAGVSVIAALAFGIGVSMFYTLLLASRLPRRLGRLLAIHTLAAAAATAAFVIVAPVEGLGEAALAIVVAAMLTAPYARALYKARFA